MPIHENIDCLIYQTASKLSDSIFSLSMITRLPSRTGCTNSLKLLRNTKTRSRMLKALTLYFMRCRNSLFWKSIWPDSRKQNATISIWDCYIIARTLTKRSQRKKIRQILPQYWAVCSFYRRETINFRAYFVYCNSLIYIIIRDDHNPSSSCISV